MTLSTTIKTLAFASILALAPSQMMAAQKGGTFTTGDKTFLLNGKPFVVKAAELHYPRIPRAYWEHRIKMCKALGMNTICLYVFWNIPNSGLLRLGSTNSVCSSTISTSTIFISWDSRGVACSPSSI